LTPFYRFCYLLLNVLFRTLGRLKVEGLENLPRQGGFILAGNHQSYLDPPIVGSSVPKQVYFMAKEELFKVPVLKTLITAQQAFPVKRGSADRKALSKALELLSQNKVVGIFPEGGRSKTGELQEAEMGVAFIALKAQVPVLPMAIVGTKGFACQHLRQIKVKIGKPIYPKIQEKFQKSDIEAMTAQIMDYLSQLIEEIK